MLYMYIIMVKFSLYIMYVQVVFINLFFVYVNKPEDDNHVENIQDSEGANIDRRLVPYTRDAMRTKSRIEFIYLFIPSPGAKRRPRAEGPRARVLISTGV